MINYVHGTLAEVESGFIVVEAGGVGYGIFVPASVIGELPHIGEEIKVYTHFSVREDEQSLFGFLYREDREMFLRLLSVSGIGPKGALGILSVLKPNDLRLAIVTGDAKAISRAPGIGAKTAQRVILELRDKIDTASSYAADTAGAAAALAQPENAGRPGPVEDAVDALEMLGYSRMEAGRAVRSISLTPDMSSEKILKLALKAVK